MSVPLEIRQVKRPVNTVVIDSGREGPNRYQVLERKKVIYVKGGNPQPRNGKVIGHIVGGKFVPVEPKNNHDEDGMLSYGASAFVRSVSSDILDDLLKSFDVKTAYMILTAASLKVIRPSIKMNRYSTHYNRSFLKVWYPGMPLSKNTVSKLFENLGMDIDGTRKFFALRLDRVMNDHHVIIDGTLKEDNSCVNDLSAFSYKGRVKGARDISVLYAYDLETMEPLCSEVFPGNMIDASSFKHFIRDNDITKGIIMADKGFPITRIEDELKERPDLRYISPLKRNDKRIANNNMYDYEGVFNYGYNDRIQYKKAVIKGGSYLYSFRSNNKAQKEERNYRKKKETFGTIVFISDEDLKAEDVYRIYSDRWQLEVIFRQYKDTEELNTTNVQNDFSVYGAEFINFIATLLTTRMIKKADKAGLLEDMSFKDLLEDLGTAWRKVRENDTPKADDRYWVHPFSYALDELTALNLIEGIPEPPKKKRGRPRKNEFSTTV